MALTATATIETQVAVCKVLEMSNPVIISKSPNIKYIVKVRPGTLEEAFKPITEQVRQLNNSFQRTIIFCRSYDACSHIYLFIYEK